MDLLQGVIMRTDPKQAVLVSVLGRKKDLEILLSNGWYRIPAAKLPARPFKWIAFYQTSAFGKEGKRIRYYGRVKEKKRVLRSDLLPDEPGHPGAKGEYYKFTFSGIKELPKPITNKTGMRFVFGFTTPSKLLRCRSLHVLFGIRPLEKIFRKALKRRKIYFFPEYPIILRRRIRYRLDIAIFCKRGKIDIECDMPKYHSGRRYKHDKHRNNFLKRRGWMVIRFTDEDILFDIKKCLKEVEAAIARLGGFSHEI